MNKSILAALLLALVPGAQAADLAALEAAPAVVSPEVAASSDPQAAADFTWSGFYAGINAAYIEGPAKSVGATSGVATELDISGGLLGGTIGYNAQYGQFLLGAEGDIALSDATGVTSCALATALSCRGELNWIGSLRGRAGIAYDSVLLFATAGVTAADVTASVNTVTGSAIGSHTGTMTGWTVGGGIETALTSAFSIKAEYSYADLGGLQAPGGTLANEATNLSAINHAVKFGLNYHF